MKVKMHRRQPGRLAVILMGAVMVLASFPASAQGGGEPGALFKEIGTKDLGERGELVIPALDLSDAELTVVLRAIAKFSGLNIIASEDVEGKVSLFWEDVTVRNALDAILTTNDLGYICKANVVYVLPASRLGEDRVQTITRVYFLQYLDAAEVEESLKQVFTSAGAAGGSAGQAGGNTISSNVSSNAILITDTPEQVKKIVALLDEIDRPFKQVRIEARLVELRLTQDMDVGIDWTYFEEGSEQNRADVNLTPFDKMTGMTDAPGMFQFGLIRDGGKTLTGFIQADANDTKVRVLANPTVTALHNTKALIRITNDIPYVEANISQGVITESVSFKETGITLEVTPRINDEGEIVMRVKPIQRIAGPRIILQNSNAFPVDERSVETELRVPDGTTIVIGGLRSSENEKTKQKVPGFGDIPFLGLLFQRNLDKLIETDLLLFVTPSIVKDYELTEKEASKYEEFRDVNENLKKRIEEEEQRELEQEERKMRREARNEAMKVRKQEWRERRGLEEPEGGQASSATSKARTSSTALDWEGGWSVDEDSNEIVIRGDSLVSAPSSGR